MLSKIEAVYPEHLDATVSLISKDSSVQVEFPLMNQGDNITFSILIADYSGTPFEAGARIVGVEELSVVRRINQPERAEKSISWSVYMTGAFSLLLLYGAIVNAFNIEPEFAFKRKLREGIRIVPATSNKEDLYRIVRNELSWAVSPSFGPLNNYIRNISGEVASEAECSMVEELMRTVAREATSTVVLTSIFFSMSALGVAYVLYQIL